MNKKKWRVGPTTYLIRIQNDGTTVFASTFTIIVGLRINIFMATATTNDWLLKVDLQVASEETTDEA